AKDRQGEAPRIFAGYGCGERYIGDCDAGNQEGRGFAQVEEYDAHLLRHGPLRCHLLWEEGLP
ncbi:hypothetical protein C0991_002682, partial [Blastosporella zonata]